MVFDWDDHHEHQNAMPWMLKLKQLNPKFKATLFSVPAHGSPTFWKSHPSWIELAVHGHTHHSNYECATWDHNRMQMAINYAPTGFVNGFKAPGWQISDACYSTLRKNGWWVADQHLEDGRRPEGLRTYLYEDGGNWHGHVQNVCGNGLEETWETVCRLVSEADSFEFASEKAVTWQQEEVAA